MHRYRLLKSWIASVVLVVTATALQAANNQILIKTVASQEYVKQRVNSTSAKTQTYNFFEGRYFPGNVKNRGMERFTFMDVITNMAEHLKKQGYYNHPEVGEADLLIVVHYGATDYEESFFDQMGFTSLENMGYADNMDASALANFQFNVQVMESMNQANERSRFGKAQMLGMEEAFTRDTPRWERESLQTSLKDARYFVILMAYDFPLLKQGEVKLLWSTRYSIRAVGQSFEQAIKDMNRAAADYYGQNLNGLQKRRANDESRVVIGELEVISEEQE